MLQRKTGVALDSVRERVQVRVHTGLPSAGAPQDLHGGHPEDGHVVLEKSGGTIVKDAVKVDMRSHRLHRVQRKTSKPALDRS